jgi:hypothetical protein
VQTVGRWGHEPWADFAFTNDFAAQLHRWNDEPWRKRLPHRLLDLRAGKGQLTAMTEVARYRYALHLPGGFAGTYSRTLQYLLWTGTTVLLYEQLCAEFYYHRLTPWVHYIPVNASNLGERVGWARSHPTEAAAIGAAGQALAARYLTGRRVGEYWQAALRAYHRIQHFTLKLPADACTCWSMRRSRPTGVPDEVHRCPLICDVGGG